MVPADDEHTGSTEATRNTNKKEREPARLTPIPGWLMKWWIPILLALILLAAGCFLAAIWRMPLRPVSWWKINLYWPPSWPFNYHWPSKDAMALCATIAGAGFAFSAWQQRSHDNAARERERTTNTQREEFWHRRNTAYALLSTNSIYEQQEGVCRYLELADELNKRSQNNATSIQIFNASILSALCTHIRHLGAPPPQFIGDEIARGELQNLILQNILKRVNTNLAGYWDGLAIDLTNVTFLTTVSIVNFTSKSEIHLNKSNFKQKVNIEITNSVTFYWKECSFLSKLEMTGKSTDPGQKKPLLLNDNLPQKINLWKFKNIAFCILEDLEHQITPGRPFPTKSYPSFENCDFLRPKATQQNLTEVSVEADTEIFNESEASAPPDNFIWAAISFNFELLDKNANILYFSDCKFARANPLKYWNVSHTCFTRCNITQCVETDQKNIAPFDFEFIDCHFASHTNDEALTTAQK